MKVEFNHITVYSIGEIKIGFLVSCKFIVHLNIETFKYKHIINYTCFTHNKSTFNTV